MPRPMKWRQVAFTPKACYFVPKGKSKCTVQEVVLKVEELEAMRLKDIEDLHQEECASHMGVSRQTFQLILEGARKKVTEALVEGKAIRIYGGNYTKKLCDFHCRHCGRTFTEAYEVEHKTCHTCGSDAVTCSKYQDSCQRCCERIGNDSQDK